MPAKGWSLGIPAPALLKAVGIDQATKAGVFAGAQSLRSTWFKVLKRKGGGKQYAAGLQFFTTKKSPRRVVAVMKAGGLPRRQSSHVASKPGDPPSSDTGALAEAVAVEEAEGHGAYKVGMGGKIGRIGLVLEYGLNVAGTKVGKHPGGIVIQPRPHARTAKTEGLDHMRGQARVGFASKKLRP